MRPHSNQFFMVINIDDGENFQSRPSPAPAQPRPIFVTQMLTRDMFAICYNVNTCRFYSLYAFGALTLLVGRQEGCLACKKLDVVLLVVMI